MLPSHAPQLRALRQTFLSIRVERSTLTEDQHLMLELIADDSLPATSEIVRDMLALVAARLIEMTPAGKWQVTRLGEAVLQRHDHWLN
jgi:hypothetical protein